MAFSTKPEAKFCQRAKKALGVSGMAEVPSNMPKGGVQSGGILGIKVSCRLSDTFHCVLFCQTQPQKHPPNMNIIGNINCLHFFETNPKNPV